MSADIDLLRTAWRYANTGSTAPDVDADAAFDELIEAFKKRQRAVGYMAAQEAMQATIDGSIREVQAKAWEEGWESAVGQAPGDVFFDEWCHQTNPYGSTAQV